MLLCMTERTPYPGGFPCSHRRWYVVVQVGRVVVLGDSINVGLELRQTEELTQLLDTSLFDHA